MGEKLAGVRGECLRGAEDGMDLEERENGRPRVTGDVLR
jgi:hypothetical protein